MTPMRKGLGQQFFQLQFAGGIKERGKPGGCRARMIRRPLGRPQLTTRCEKYMNSVRFRGPYRCRMTGVGRVAQRLIGPWAVAVNPDAVLEFGQPLDQRVQIGVMIALTLGSATDDVGGRKVKPLQTTTGLSSAWAAQMPSSRHNTPSSRRSGTA